METSTTITETPEEKKPSIIMAGSSNTGSLLIGTGILLVVGYLGYNKLESAKQAADQSKQDDIAASDQPTNLANQIYAENRATLTSDSKMVDLYNQITDYKATKDAYTKVSLGKDMLADTEKHVSSSTYQQLLNILGIKGGSKKASSKTVAASVKVVSSAKVTAKWLKTKVDTRIRKTPVAISTTSAILHFSKTNIVGSVPANTTVGFIDITTLSKNGNQPFYDSKNDVYFLPVLVFDKKDLNKQYTVYVAASTVDEFDSMPPGSKLLKINQADYDGAKSVSGLSGLGSADNMI